MNALSGFIAKLVSLIIQPLIVLLVTAGVAYFIWGVAMFIWSSQESDKRKEGTQHLLWGIVGIVIMVACVGILQIVLSTFGVSVQR
jgi:hypothetical protein